ncbi:MAG: PilN domain-containing protein [Myxococcales bacterium]|jgi:type IV pilus assembly protein PilN|nr:PilN domain-containing protein [Myxococcales bacterium]
MLKVNLLPNAPSRAGGEKQAAAGDLRTFALGMSIMLVLLAAGIMIFHSSQTKVLDNSVAANNQRDLAVKQIKRRVADHPRVRSELQEIRARRDAIQRLEANRTGPTAMLVEVSQLLSPGGRPTNDPSEFERIQRDDPTRWMHANWDTHQIWLSSFGESERQVTIEGHGRSADDVAEFMRRLMLSEYFEQVTLERSEGAQDQDTRLQVQRFKITARVRY